MTLKLSVELFLILLLAPSMPVRINDAVEANFKETCKLFLLFFGGGGLTSLMCVFYSNLIFQGI